MDRSTMMKMCFPSRMQPYSKLPTFDDYSEQFSDEAPLNRYDSLESPTSSRRSSLISGASNAYDPEPASSKKEAAREIDLGLTGISYDKDRAKETEEEEGVEKGSDAARDAGACEEEGKGQDAGDKEVTAPSSAPRSRVVRFLHDTMAQKPLPPMPSISRTQVTFGQLSFAQRWFRSGYQPVENTEAW